MGKWRQWVVATHAGFATANASLHAVDMPLYAANVGLQVGAKPGEEERIS